MPTVSEKLAAAARLFGPAIGAQLAAQAGVTKGTRMPVSLPDERLDRRLDAFQDLIYGVEEAAGAPTAHAVINAMVGGLVTKTKASVSPSAARLDRAVAELRRLMGDAQAAAALEAYAAQVRAGQDAEGAGGVDQVARWLQAGA